MSTAWSTVKPTVLARSSVITYVAESFGQMGERPASVTALPLVARLTESLPNVRAGEIELSGRARLARHEEERNGLEGAEQQRPVPLASIAGRPRR